MPVSQMIHSFEPDLFNELDVTIVQATDSSAELFTEMNQIRNMS